MNSYYSTQKNCISIFHAEVTLVKSFGRSGIMAHECCYLLICFMSQLPLGLMGEIMHKVHKIKMLHLVIIIKTLKEQNVSYVSGNRRT